MKCKICASDFTPRTDKQVYCGLMCVYRDPIHHAGYGKVHEANLENAKKLQRKQRLEKQNAVK